MSLKNTILSWLIINEFDSPKKLVVPHMSGFTFLEENNIVYLKAKRNYTQIYIKDYTSMLSIKSLTDFEKILKTSPAFFKTHRSFIINLNYLEDLINKDGGYLLMANEMKIPISKIRKEVLFEIIRKT